jgi:pimeloyl-ACP methyl ester carboxylesterase
MASREIGFRKVAFDLIRFKIIDIIEKIACPTLFIHGKNDKVIPWKHSLALMEKCKCAAKLVTPERMEHNYFNTKIDIVSNMRDFINSSLRNDSIDVVDVTDENERISNSIHFPIFMFKNPNTI